MIGSRSSVGRRIRRHFSSAAYRRRRRPRRWSEEWYEQRAGDPPGARKIYKHGKLWPPYPRPVGQKQTYWHAYHTAKYWPYPYNCEDRAFERGILQQQANAGWEIATTLHDYHFDEETNRLNTAGEAHLRWILTQARQQYRTTFVASGTNAEIGEFRLAHVQNLAREITAPTARRSCSRWIPSSAGRRSKSTRSAGWSCSLNRSRGCSLSAPRERPAAFPDQAPRKPAARSASRKNRGLVGGGLWVTRWEQPLSGNPPTL